MERVFELVTYSGHTFQIRACKPGELETGLAAHGWPHSLQVSQMLWRGQLDGVPVPYQGTKGRAVEVTS